MLVRYIEFVVVIFHRHRLTTNWKITLFVGHSLAIVSEEEMLVYGYLSGICCALRCVVFRLSIVVEERKESIQIFLFFIISFLLVWTQVDSKQDNKK